MFRHVVMFKWSDEVDEAHLAATAAALDGLPGAIPEIRAYHHGADAGVNEGNFDYVVVVDFDSVDGYVTYRDSTAHVELVRDFLAGHLADRSAVQYELGS